MYTAYSAADSARISEPEEAKVLQTSGTSAWVADEALATDGIAPAFGSWAAAWAVAANGGWVDVAMPGWAFDIAAGPFAETAGGVDVGSMAWARVGAGGISASAV